MKIIKNQPFEVCKERSYVNCISQGLSHGTENVGFVWKNLWPVFVLNLFVNFPVSLFLWVAIAVLMPKWSEMGYVPRMTWKDQWPVAWKAFCRMLPLLGVSIFVASLCFAAFYLIGLSASLVHWAVFGGVALLMFVFLIPFEWVKLQLLYSDKSVRKCFAEYKVGLRNFSKLFSFYLLLGMMVLLVLAVASVPLVVQMIVLQQVNVAEANGDIALVPWYFWLLFFLSSVIATAVMFYVQVLFSHAEYLFWGCISASEKSRESVEEIPA